MLGFGWLVLGACILPPSENVRNYKPPMSHSCSLTAFLSPAAEGPGLGNKLVSFNIHNWWKEISRSVKMGLKGLCKTVSIEWEDRREGGGWQKEWSRDLGCSEARTRLRKQTEQSHRQQAQNLSACQWDRASAREMYAGHHRELGKIHACNNPAIVFLDIKKDFTKRSLFSVAHKITGFRKFIIR